MKTQIRLELDLTIDLPTLPNYIKAAGFDQTIAVEKISDAQLKEIGEAWTKALILHAQERRKPKSR